MDSSETGIGVGVRHLVKGFDEEVATEEFEKVDVVETLLSVLDWRDLRRKGID